MREMILAENAEGRRKALAKDCHISKPTSRNLLAAMGWLSGDCTLF